MGVSILASNQLLHTSWMFFRSPGLTIAHVLGTQRCPVQIITHKFDCAAYLMHVVVHLCTLDSIVSYKC